MSKAPLIYYVEDDEHIRDLTAYALHQAGMEVRAFHDGDGLVERCAAEPPDAVLLDIMLPGDDGLVLLQALRGNTATENMPIMMLTAKGTEFDKVVDSTPAPMTIWQSLRHDGTHLAGERAVAPCESSGPRRRRRDSGTHDLMVVGAISCRRPPVR
ncbi:MAG: response regulator [Adlercreutzia equolifaciens]